MMEGGGEGSVKELKRDEREARERRTIENLKE